MKRKRLPPDDPREWISRAKSNLALARNVIPEADLEDLCFDAQQAAEKSSSLAAALQGSVRVIRRNKGRKVPSGRRLFSCLDTDGMPTYSDQTMQVRFTPEEEARLLKIATQEGVDPEELVKDAALRLVEDDALFRAGVRKGVEQADLGEFIEEKEMDERVKRMLQP